MGNTFASTKDGGNLWSVRLESLKEKAKSLVMQLSEHLLDVPAALESISRDFIASRLPPYSGSEELGPQGRTCGRHQGKALEEPQSDRLV